MSSRLGLGSGVLVGSYERDKGGEEEKKDRERGGLRTDKERRERAAPKGKQDLGDEKPRETSGRS